MSAPAEQRAQAARLLHQVVVRRRTTDQVLADRSAEPLIQELLLGSLRHFFSLERQVGAALRHPVKPKDQDLWCLMIVGAYQLRHTRIPDHAAIFETVSACGPLRKPWARGLVNAVLRAVAAQPAPTGELDHPPWLDAALRREYPDAETLMAANNLRAPMSLRINRCRVDVEDYERMLASAGLTSRPACAWHDDGGSDPAEVRPGPETRVLEHPVPVKDLPGHGQGLVSVQDAGAQFAAPLLMQNAASVPDVRVLDACAAPGGKLFHLLERCPRARVTGLELRAERLARLGQERQRLGHEAVTLVLGDAERLEWWNGESFTHVLVDAPCSGTGTLRRHPDIKVLRRADDVRAFAELQSRLLANLWQVLEPGGTLLYCTCSILAAENDDVIAGFLRSRHDAVLHTIRLASGRATRHGWQLLPTQHETDGFYYARMSKAR